MINDLHTWANAHGISAEAFSGLMAILNPTRPPIKGAEGTEADLQAELRILSADCGAALWRNNNGAAVDESGRHIRFGLGNDSKKLSERWKSSDLIGVTPMRAAYAGQVLGVFTAVEVKKPGWKKPSNAREHAQDNFHKSVRGMGGIALFAQSTHDVRTIYG